MFTGIIEALGQVTDIIAVGANKIIWVESSVSMEFKVDQSISHSGICLTIEEVSGNRHRVTAIEETVIKTDISRWSVGSIVNLERCLQINGRLDGHFVQGHVDTVGTCINRKERKGSWEFTIQFPGDFAPLVVEKGSISLNGISLTCFNVTSNEFTVAIIPYTFEHTNMNNLQFGNQVNLEFDLIGKYIDRRLSLQNSNSQG